MLNGCARDLPASPLDPPDRGRSGSLRVLKPIQLALGIVAGLAALSGVFGTTVAAAPRVIAAVPFAVGGRHVCALPGDGTVLCWGDLDQPQNQFGELGDATVIDPNHAAGDAWVQHVVVADQSGADGGDCADVTQDGFVVRCHGSNALTGVTAITAGYSHTCALLVDTTVKCWGSNAPIDGGQFAPSYSGGELGDGTTTVRPAPVAVIAGPDQTTPLRGVRSLSAATGYTCAVMTDNTAKCWGNAPQQTSLAPVTVMADATQPLADIASLSAGDRMACAVLLDGRVVCWGSGYLGDQHSSERGVSPLPVTVTVAGVGELALDGIRDVTLAHDVGNPPNGIGLGHSCALDTAGGVNCWGFNDVSQLGIGSNGLTDPDPQRDYAVPVVAAIGSTDTLAGVSEVAAGGYFTCALIDDGSVKCWGISLGGDSLEGGGAPVALTIAGGQAVAIGAGGGTICASLADGSLWCSDTEYGMSAVPGVTIATPIPAPTSTSTAASSATPGPGGGADVGGARAIAVGLSQGCAVLADGGVACWYDADLVAELVPGISDATDIAHGDGFACALRATGSVLCWGLNTQGQLGNGTLMNDPTPTPVVGISDAIAVVAGDLHACALRAGGGVMCWGLDAIGQLGDGRATENSPLPVPVSGLTDAVAIAAGNDHTCAIRAGGGVMCWGSAAQLGNGAQSGLPGLTPVPVVGVDDATAIGSGSFQTCVARSGGGVECWGLDLAQRATDGSTVFVTTPTPIPGISDATAVAGGQDYECAVRSGGAVVCWGSNAFGQLGDGTLSDRPTPVAVAGIADASSAAAGQTMTCALVTGGGIKCWGSSSLSPAAVTLPEPTQTPGPSASPTPTPTPTNSPGPTTAPAATDSAGLAGDWYVSYGGRALVTIAFADGQYSVVAKTPLRVTGSSCDLAPGTLIATFSASGGSYVGQNGLWNTANCHFLRWIGLTLRLEGDRLAATLANGEQPVFTRALVAFRDSVPTPGQITLDPIIVLQSVAVALGFVLLIPFPGALFDNTLEANYAEIMGWVRSARRRFGSFGRRRPASTGDGDQAAHSGDGWRSAPRVAFALVLGVLLGCLLDPTFGLNLVSAATFVGVLGGVVVTMFVFALPRLMAYRANRRTAGQADDRSGWEPYVRALPAALAVAIACVMISRLTNFQPGYLYGLIIGVTAGHELSDRQSAWTAAAATVVMLLIAAAAWFGLGWVEELAPATGDPDLALVVLQTVLVTVMVAGLQGSLFSLLPLRFFAGAKMIKWNRRVWAGLLLIAGLGFWHVLVNPTSGYLADSSRAPLLTIVALLVLFGFGSVAFWAFFRFRRRPPAAATAAG